MTFWGSGKVPAYVISSSVFRKVQGSSPDAITVAARRRQSTGRPMKRPWPARQTKSKLGLLDKQTGSKETCLCLSVD